MTKFSGCLLFFDLTCLILLGVPMYLYIGVEVFTPFFIAFLITTLLAILSYYPFTRMKHASVNRYLAAILFGMLLRMIFIGLSIVVVFVFSDLHKIGFTVGLLFSYISKIVIEVIILTRNQRGHTSVLQ